jgi:hypothetical protein
MQEDDRPLPRKLGWDGRVQARQRRLQGRWLNGDDQWKSDRKRNPQIVRQVMAANAGLMGHPTMAPLSDFGLQPTIAAIHVSVD